MSLIGREWTLVVHDEDPAGVVYGVERGHTDTGAPKGFEVVHVVEHAAYREAVDALKRIAFNGDWWAADHAAPLARETLREMGLYLDLLAGR